MDGRTIQGLIDSLPRGYGHEGVPMHVRLPAGRIPVAETIVSGGDTNRTNQVGLQISGAGAPDIETHGGDRGSGGTILEWVGEPGGTVWRHEGGDSPRWENLSIEMNQAGVGLALSGSNAGGAGTGHPQIRHVRIEGPWDRTRYPGSVGLLITGARQNDRVDALRAVDLFITNVDTCVRTENRMALANRIVSSELKCLSGAVVHAVYGSMTLEGCITNVFEPDGVFFDVEWEADYLRFHDLYAEVQECDAVLRYHNGDRPWKVHAPNVVFDQGCRFNLQVPRAALVKGPVGSDVIFRDTFFKAAGGPGKPEARAFVLAAEGSPQLNPRIIFRDCRRHYNVRPGPFLNQTKNVEILGTLP